MRQSAQIVVGPILQVVHGNRRIRYREETIDQLGRRREEDIGQKIEGRGRIRNENQQIDV